jgi:RHS repeat-associated protein
VGSATTADQQYVWGQRYLDELVERDRDADANSGNGLEERLYALQDANYNVTAVANTLGVVQERYAYSAYGQPTFMDGSFGNRSSSSYGWNLLFAGYRYDIESGFYQVRNRVYHPGLGRWFQRDNLPYADGMNLYQAVMDNPVEFTDPTGQIAPAVAVAAAAGGVALVCGYPYYWIAQSKWPKGSQDKLKHCWVSCMIARQCGLGVAAAAGATKEVGDLIRGGSWSDSEADLSADADGLKIAGVECAITGGGMIGRWFRQSCENGCHGKGY